MLSLIKTSKIIYANDGQVNWDHSDFPTLSNQLEMAGQAAETFISSTRETVKVIALFLKCGIPAVIGNKLCQAPTMGITQFIQLE